MKYPIPDSEDIEWQQDMLREMTALYDAIVAGKIDGLGKVG